MTRNLPVIIDDMRGEITSSKLKHRYKPPEMTKSKGNPQGGVEK
jgi:hypothetical protein